LFSGDCGRHGRRRRGVFHLIIGLIFLVLGVVGVVSWWADFGLVMRGLIPFLLVIGGLVAIGAGLARANGGPPGDKSEDPE